MSSTHGSTRDAQSAIRDTVRDTVKEAKDAAREGAKAMSEGSGNIQADLDSLRGDIRRLTEQITDIVTSKGNAAWARARLSNRPRATRRRSARSRAVMMGGL